jgi:hypothetical protein
MKAIFLAAALAAFAAPAFAGAPWTATPVQPLTRSNIVTGAVIWDCSDSGCRTTSDTTGADSLSACKALVRQVGEVSAFTFEGASYNATRLGHCNEVAVKAKS